ncbi:DinB family protein [Mucilaginibacter sp. HMF7410]|uniref:DinB family protein n=1 Tax=Mucilaginibacter arboris TaxID=2682090 RepID=A0A7K1SS48_9SPHI|nr:DinB family protein [Mucilaginibacter arboris]
MSKPKPEEYAPFYQGYVDLVGDDDVLEKLSSNQKKTYEFFLSLPPDKADFAYAEGKWSVKEVLGHMIDTERIMSYRLLRFSRADHHPLAGFNENFYTSKSNYRLRELEDLADEFSALRKANLYLYKNLTEEELKRKGKASNAIVSVKALLYIISGHEMHHINIIKERYL